MQVTEVLNEKLKREYKVSIPSTLVHEKMQEFFLKKGQTVRLNGYRPGKVPLPILRNYFLKEALESTLKNLVQEGYSEILKTFSILPLVTPKYTVSSFGEGKNLEYSVALEVAPEVPEISWDDLSLVCYLSDIDDEVVEERLKDVAAAHKIFLPYPQAKTAERGDTVITNLEMRSPKLSHEHKKMDSVAIELNDVPFGPALVEKLIGVQAGDVLELPWDPSNPESENPDLMVKFIIKDVRQTVQAQVDNVLAKDLGYADLEAMRVQLKADLKLIAEDMAFLILKRQVLDYLDNKYSFDVPERMVQIEFQNLWQSTLQEWGIPPKSDNDHDDGSSEKRKALFLEKAGSSEESLMNRYQRMSERRVRLSFILGTIGRSQNIFVSSEEVKALISHKASQNSQEEGLMAAFYQKNPQALEFLVQPLFEKKVVDFIKDRVSCREDQVPYSELEALYRKIEGDFFQDQSVGEHE